jgi:hypothetical protein
MLRINNKTPFETSIALHGSIRIINPPLEITRTLDSSPPFLKYFYEFIKIIWYGPFMIDPWTDFNIKLKSDTTTNLTMGFNDVRTNWTRHTPGIFQWDSNFNEITITCVPGAAKIKQQKRGPAIASDIPLHIKTESENPSWKEVEKPITTIQYSPTLDVNYYIHQR